METCHGETSSETRPVVIDPKLLWSSCGKPLPLWPRSDFMTWAAWWKEFPIYIYIQLYIYIICICICICMYIYIYIYVCMIFIELPANFRCYWLDSFIRLCFLLSHFIKKVNPTGKAPLGSQVWPVVRWGRNRRSERGENGGDSLNLIPIDWVYIVLSTS